MSTLNKQSVMPHEEIVAPCPCANPNCKIPYGRCHCGCGMVTTLAKETSHKTKRVKGFPNRFISGHQSKPRVNFRDAMPFKIDGKYCKLISLTKHEFAIVEAEDFTWLDQKKWCAMWNICTKSYYAARREKHGGKWKQVRMHREIMGDPKGKIVDHKNGVTLLNIRSNLRIADASQNASNSRRRSDNTSGVKGVFWEKAREQWRVRVQFRSKGYHGGFFSDLEDAKKAHVDLYARVVGEFAREGVFQ